MQIIGIYEAKTRLSELIKYIELGEEFAISKHGKIVAKLSPPDNNKKNNTRKFFQKLEELVENAPIRASFEEMIEWKNAGRK